MGGLLWRSEESCSTTLGCTGLWVTWLAVAKPGCSSGPRAPLVPFWA